MRLQLACLAMGLVLLDGSSGGQQTEPPVQPATIALSDSRVALVGRYGATAAAGKASPDSSIRIAYPGAGFVVAFRGHALALKLLSSSDTNALAIVVDHGQAKTLVLARGEQVVSLVDDPAGNQESSHLVEVYKQSETWQGLIDLETLTPGVGTELLAAPRRPARKLMFVGDSVTCGSGVARDDKCTNDPKKPNEDPYDAFDMLLGRRLDAQVNLVCYGGRGLERDYRGKTSDDGVLNAPDFLDLAVATDAPETRQPWAASLFVPDAIVVQLGTNDFSLQKTKPLNGDAFAKDYVQLLHRIRAEYPKTLIVATEGPIVTDPLLRTYVREAVRQAGDPRILWAPSKHYPGNSCDGHPTREQHERMADDLEPLLREELGW